MSISQAWCLRRLARLTALLVATSAVWIPGSIALGQTPSAESSEGETPAAQPIALEEVPDRAEATRAEIGILLPGDAPRQMLERIGSEVDRTLPEVEALLAKTRAELAAEPTIDILNESGTALAEMRDRLRPWHDELDRQLDTLRPALERLDGLAAIWKQTAETAQRADAAGPALKRIAAVRQEIDRARSSVLERRNRILALRDRLVDPSNALAASFEQVQVAAQAGLSGIFQADRPPLWSPQVRKSLRDDLKVVGTRPFLEGLGAGRRYAGDPLRMLGFQVALLVALGSSLRALRSRARAKEENYDLGDARKVFEHPWAMALMIVVFLTNPLHAGARYAGALPALAIALAVLRIGLSFLVSAMAPLAWGLTLLFVVDRGRTLLDATPTLERFAFLLEMGAALGLLFWLLRPTRLASIPEELRRARFLVVLGIAMRVAAALLATAILADVAGWGDLGILLGSSALRSAFVALSIFVLYKIFASLAAFALLLWPLRLLRSISRHRLLVRHRLERLLAGAAGLVWVALVLGQLGLLAPATAGVSRVLESAISVGALSVSLGDVMAFALTVWLSFQLARLVDFILQEDVFTRVQTARGVPYAITGLVRYTLISFGFLVGLSAAGFELSKLTIIVGGLGVGLGFGLQNVVNNFVSGLVLLFERPIQVGDTIQLPDVWGTMKHIGIRASVIRTFDGADVIVPNGMLISDKVTNWTYADTNRRIEVDVGVEYGTPARRVIDLLVAVARANPQVSTDPEPRAFFLNFGDSSLDFKLRAWVENFDDSYSTMSDLAVAVQEALEEAGIGVPFPQRDLHLVSVSPTAASELERGTTLSPRGGTISDSPGKK
jgi:small-conductance mechanosensitive channel